MRKLKAAQRNAQAAFPSLSLKTGFVAKVGFVSTGCVEPPDSTPHLEAAAHFCNKADKKGKDFLTEGEVKRPLDAAKGRRYGQRDYLRLLLAYRHGLGVSELLDLRLKDVDLDTSRLFVRRKKGSHSTHQPIEGDELRAHIRLFTRRPK